MLQLHHITKQYKTGELVQHALHGVSLTLRDNEFVSILGPSGSGKTTLLNIIGGLDRYDSGDLVINGTSTRDYRDRDWDTYRNHTIGFVFQSYNLIPHQSILANVELALTIGGISRRERRLRAKEALEAVGLGDQCHKKPNQLSGGQMQRVAIARALVNDPDILLADEPTGALDTETSIQVMELLKEVARNRLVVMVTHNPELAESYSTRIVKFRDGKILSDTDPCTGEEPQPAAAQPKGKARMDFLTALSLSFHNLQTKIGRTLLTAFAGSIGIIGIALILALSNGVNNYITNIQKDTMASYPITITAQTLDLSGMMNIRSQVMGELEENRQPSLRDGVYSDSAMMELANMYAASITENNLTAFRNYLEDPDSEIHAYLGENGVVYTYNISFSVFTRDPDGAVLDTNASADDTASSPLASMMQSGTGLSSAAGSVSTAENFSELTAGSDGTGISPALTDSYELLYGSWPEAYNEVILILDRNNAISSHTLYQLGLITGEEYRTLQKQVDETGEAEVYRFDYADVCEKTFWLVPACDYYRENGDGTFSYVGESTDILLENAIELSVVGIVRPVEDAANASVTTAVAYCSALTDYVIEYANRSPVIRAQEQAPAVNVLTGVNFAAADEDTMIADTVSYLRALPEEEKASLYTAIQYLTLSGTGSAGGEGSATGESGSAGGTAGSDDASKAAALDLWLDNEPDREILLMIYEEYVGSATYESNMEAFGKVSYDAPASISIYADSFEAKEAIAQCIVRYNAGVSEDDRITYVDYVQLLTSSLTSVIDVISYVLIAFVAVSLVVSSMMIGIITHISVMERTKEIGILRALGASRSNISQVFNAETMIIGLCSGILGVSVTALLTIPINGLLDTLLEGGGVAAQLPLGAALILVAVSVVITITGGLLPAGKAAKMDPVRALRSE